MQNFFTLLFYRLDNFIIDDEESCEKINCEWFVGMYELQCIPEILCDLINFAKANPTEVGYLGNVLYIAIAANDWEADCAWLKQKVFDSQDEWKHIVQDVIQPFREILEKET